MKHAMGVAFLFPGQGSQISGMLHVLPDHPEIRRTLNEVSDSLAQNVFELDSTAALQSTICVQLALLASGVATARALIADGAEPEAVAGMSVGAFAAAVVAGVLKLADSIRLVKQRAEMMVELYPKGYGLAAIVGLNEEQVTILVQKIHSVQMPVYVANINAPRQIVIAGSNDGMNRVLEAALKSGARKAVLLDVSEPSHCPLLEPVVDVLKKSSRSMRMQQPKMVYMGNVTGRALRGAEAIADDCTSNIAHGVRWYDATTVLEELGFRRFLEMPPGHVLSRLAGEAFPDIQTVAVGDISLRDAVRLGTSQRDQGKDGLE
jgi:malonate decarboxylase epsilon subunit